MKPFPCLLATVGLLGACRTLEPVQSQVQSAGAPVSPGTAATAAPSMDVTCAASSLQTFGLAAITPMPAFDLGVLPGSPRNNIPDAPVLKVAPTGLLNVRFDACVDGDGTATLRRIVHTIGAFGGSSTILVLDQTGTVTAPEFGFTNGQFFTVMPRSAYTVTGFDRAVFGDYSTLAVQVTDASGGQFVVKGAPGGGAALAGRLFRNGAAPALVTDQYLVGTIKLGDPYSHSGCAIGEDPQLLAFALGSASFRLSICTGIGTSALVGTYIKASVTDGNPALPAGVRGVEVAVDPAHLASVGHGAAPAAPSLLYSFTHHNNCAGFVLTTAHATYAATSTGGAFEGGSCPPERVVPGAPSWTTAKGQGETDYTVSYGGGAPTAGSVPGCAEYFRCVPGGLPP